MSTQELHGFDMPGPQEPGIPITSIIEQEAADWAQYVSRWQQDARRIIGRPDNIGPTQEDELPKSKRPRLVPTKHVAIEESLAVWEEGRQEEQAQGAPDFHQQTGAGEAFWLDFQRAADVVRESEEAWEDDSDWLFYGHSLRIEGPFASETFSVLEIEEEFDLTAIERDPAEEPDKPALSPIEAESRAWVGRIAGWNQTARREIKRGTEIKLPHAKRVEIRQAAKLAEKEAEAKARLAAEARSEEHEDTPDAKANRRRTATNNRYMRGKGIFVPRRWVSAVAMGLDPDSI